MQGIDTAVFDEITTLRKGAGTQSPDLNKILGPNLRQLAGSTSVADRVDRDMLIRALTTCAARMTSEQRTAVLAGLAITDRTAAMPQLETRLDWLAQSVHCSPRTARRRFDEALRRLTEEIVKELDSAAEAPAGWLLTELDSLFRLDTATPVAIEERRITATRDHLSEIKAWWDFPCPPGERPAITAEVTHGGRLIRRAEPTGQRLELYLELPRPLAVGEEHRFGVELRAQDHSVIRPHYVFTPEMRCFAFNLRVRFDPRRMPWAVREVRAEPVRVFDAAQPGSNPIEPDGAGEIAVSFRDLRLNLGHGAQWWF